CNSETCFCVPRAGSLSSRSLDVYNGVYSSGGDCWSPAVCLPMTLSLFRIPAVTVLTVALLAAPALAQTRASEPASPYGGVTVEDIIARVNDQIITRSD